MISPSKIPEDIGEDDPPQQEKQIPGPSFELPSYSEPPRQSLSEEGALGETHQNMNR